MTNIRCLIVDDEPAAIGLIEMYVQQATNWQLVGKCYHALEVISLLKQQEVDVIFLDINMPGLTGIELAQFLPQNIKIVFVTAYAEHAMESFEFATIDYMLKPLTLQRFLKCAEKINNEFIKNNDLSKKLGDEEIQQEYFFVKSGKLIEKIDINDILYFEGEKEYVKLVTPHRPVLLYRRMKSLEQQLPSNFFRVHLSFIININHISKIADNHVYIGNRVIAISNTYRESFLELIKKRSL